VKKRYIAIIIAAGVVAALSVAVATSDRARIAFAMLLGPIFDPGPPEMIGDIRCDDWRSCVRQNQAVDAIFRKRFPVGTPAKNLEATLSKEGFRHFGPVLDRCSAPGDVEAVGKVYIPCPNWDAHWKPKNHLIYGWGSLPCGSSIGVLWSTDRTGRVMHTEGYYDYGCL
jgi:hypothetical protein